jgi:hypothetical protein
MPSSGMLHHVALVLRLLVIANVFPSLPILVTLMMEVIHPPKTSVLNKTTWHSITEDSILQKEALVSIQMDYISLEDKEALI